MILRKSRWAIRAGLAAAAAVLFSAQLPAGPVPARADDLYSYRGATGEKYYTNVPGEGRKAETARFPLRERKTGAPGAGPSAKREGAPGSHYGPVIKDAAGRFAVDPDLVRAVIKVESNFNRYAVSRKGASGLMQLMPGTARELGVSDPFDPAANIRGGTGYLSRLLDATGGDLRLGLAAYNAGLQRIIEARGMPAIAETKDYVRRVLEYYDKLKDR